MDAADRMVKDSELESYMSDLGLDPDQSVVLQDVLDGAQRELERYCKRRFTRRQHTETLTPDDMGRLWPRWTPIVSVVGLPGYRIAHGANAIVGTGFSFGGGPFGDPFAPTEVTYVGGLDPDSDEYEDVKLAILRVAAREATTRHDDVLNPNDLEARRVEDRDKRPLGFQDDELKKFDTLRRRTAV